MSNPFGGGGSQAQSSSTASNQTTVNVSTSVPINVDTAPIQAALDALAGVVSQGQQGATATAQHFASAEAAVADAILQGQIATSSAVRSLGSVIAGQTQVQASTQAQQQALQASQITSTAHVELIVAAAGIIAALITAHVLKLRW